MVKSDLIRASKKLRKLIDDIRIEFMKKGLTPPSRAKITEIIAKKLRKEDILYDKFLRFR